MASQNICYFVYIYSEDAVDSALGSALYFNLNFVEACASRSTFLVNQLNLEGNEKRKYPYDFDLSSIKD